MNQPLWKTCRALANRTRLRILRRLIEKPVLCVSDIAKIESLSETVASQNLKLLHEHDFINPNPVSKWVYYHISNFKESSYASILFKPLKKRISASRVQEGALIHIFTAYTHPRRIDIVKSLQTEPKTFEQLIKTCDISGQALYRHLNKLIARGILAETANVYRIIPQQSGLSKALEACCRQEPFSHTS